jgi:hypothetical protein
MQECMEHCVTVRQSPFIPERAQATSPSGAAYRV